jgi:uncharacterized BrkB/YihY/UPF0761 family membrane protein
MMSAPALIEVLGWCLIAVGAWSMLKNSRTVARLNRIGKRNEAVEPDLRRRAWRNLVLAPNALVWGVFWVCYRWTQDTLLWLPIVYLGALVIWEVGSRLWFRSKNGQAVGP